MMKVEGQCHCQKSKYNIEGEKQFEFFCHCSDCKVLNGGGRLSGVIFKEENFSIEGKLACYTYEGGSDKIESYFCENCGTSIYAKPLAHAGIVVVRANTLKDSSVYNPNKSLFPESAHHWDKPIL